MTLGNLRKSEKGILSEGGCKRFAYMTMQTTYQKKWLTQVMRHGGGR